MFEPPYDWGSSQSLGIYLSLSLRGQFASDVLWFTTAVLIRQVYFVSHHRKVWRRPTLHDFVKLFCESCIVTNGPLLTTEVRTDLTEMFLIIDLVVSAGYPLPSFPRCAYIVKYWGCADTEHLFTHLTIILMPWICYTCVFYRFPWYIKGTHYHVGPIFNSAQRARSCMCCFYTALLSYRTL